MNKGGMPQILALPQIKEIKKKGIAGQKKIKLKKEIPHNVSIGAIKDYQSPNNGLVTLDKNRGKKMLY